MSNKQSKPVRTIAIVSGFVVLGIFLVFLFGYLVMLLWNWLMPEIFDLPEVTYWQALGILLLSKLIFGFGGGQGSGKKDRDRRPNDREMKEKFKKWLESQEDGVTGENRAEPRRTEENS